MPALLNSQIHKYAAFFQTAYSCFRLTDGPNMYILHKIFSDSLWCDGGLRSLVFSLSLSGVSLYMVSYNVFLWYIFTGKKSTKASIQLQQLLQDDVFFRPFKQNGQCIPNTPRQDQSFVGVWAFPKAFYCIKQMTALSQPHTRLHVTTG